jgi:hypothetical protein
LKVRLTANQSALAERVTVAPNEQRRIDWLLVGSFVVYSALAFGLVSAMSGSMVAVLANGMAYFLCFGVYYAISRFFYREQYWWLFGGAATAVVVTFAIGGMSALWMIVTGWFMLLAAGIVTARLSRIGSSAGNVYLAGIAIVVLVTVIQSWSNWQLVLGMSQEIIADMMQQFRNLLVGMGYPADTVESRIESFRRFPELALRLFPGMMVLAALAQYSAGYLLFCRWARKADPLFVGAVSFVQWKAPFGLSLPLVIAILVRLLGTDPLRLAADNAILILATYYCLSGLALAEYYLQRLSVSRLMRILFYALLFFAQLAGFLVMAFLGFLDSFLNWRQRAPVEEA